MGLFWEWGMMVGGGGVALGVLNLSWLQGGSATPRVHRLTNSYKVCNIQGQLIHAITREPQ